MRSTLFGERLQQARKASGLTLRALGAGVGVSQTAIQKYERGVMFPSSDLLLKLCQVLRIPVDSLFRAAHVQLGPLKYRKQPSLSRKAEQKIVHQVRDQLERQLELEYCCPRPTAYRPLPKQSGGPEEVAMAVREGWQLGVGPIGDLMGSIEGAGVRVIELANGEEGFDGLFFWHGQEAVIAVSSGSPGDRQRFTLAHELGHLFFDEEPLCNRFAGALLFSEEAVRLEFGEGRQKIELRELFLAKHKYGLSMAAVLYRLCESGVISDALLRQWQRRFAKEGWRLCEPGAQLPRERARRFEQKVFCALAEGYIGESKAAELMGVTMNALREMRSVDGWPSDCGQ